MLCDSVLIWHYDNWSLPWKLSNIGNRLDKKSHWIRIVNLIKLKPVCFCFFFSFSLFLLYGNFEGSCSTFFRVRFVYSVIIHGIRIINDGNAWNLINYITFHMFCNKCFVLSHKMVHTLLIHTQSVFLIETAVDCRWQDVRFMCVRAKL